MTQTIALIAGPYLIVTAIGFLVSRGFYERMVLGNAKADPVLLNLSGAVHFVVGMVILVNHWQWNGLGAILVSLLGVAAVAKGASLIAVPELTLKTPKTVGPTLTMSALGFALWGAALLWVAIAT
ncbi:hypothetical protein BD830_101581 [Maritimibacter alkaliphilus HTCC2654]|uniref:Uncharacterized protein n=1 Tax=Maritimibacter alkaliphilus HTCC2654 TaxID=314271 RepID=A3VIN3_9RHOB|nr:hypothetical protein [Maritimibacter alkaliphilus]EAQ11964.1 hypothetical protein RB2654_07776 [Rhodobacterales bacterium HTCC2654] [Maritimibacter alkaliphilus HTCC2654]TYP85617.1 hypothetical protein BD830_101581 [Maritimibacter alkaliphilus HTCC2654]